MGNLKTKPGPQLEHTFIKRAFRQNKQISREVLDLVGANPQNILNVMSYNVLADRLASLSKFSHTTAPVLHFDYRAPRIIEEIKQSEASIVCL